MLIRALILSVVALPSVALADPICHRTGNGAYNQIDISPNALAAHYKHGDKTPFTLYRDADHDGYGTTSDTIEACTAVPGYVTVAGDFADESPLFSAPLDMSGVWNVVVSTSTFTSSEQMLLWGTTAAFSSMAFDGVTASDGTIQATGYYEGGITAECVGAWVSTNDFYAVCPLSEPTHVRVYR